MYVTLLDVLRINRTNLDRIACLQSIPPIVAHRRHKDAAGEWINVYDSFGLMLTSRQHQDLWQIYEETGHEPCLHSIRNHISSINFESDRDKMCIEILELLHDLIAIGLIDPKLEYSWVFGRVRAVLDAFVDKPRTLEDRKAMYLALMAALEADYLQMIKGTGDAGYGDRYFIEDSYYDRWGRIQRAYQDAVTGDGTGA